MILRRIWKGIKYGTVGGVSGGCLVYLYHNDWDVKHCGVVRFGRAAVTAARVAFDYKMTLKGQDPNSEKYNKLKSEVHLRSALRLREMCCVNGGCFIKVGQHLGALDYLLPKEYVETMKVLHSQAPQSPVSELYKVIKEDLGKEVDEIFDKFEDEPLGAASLAQVHKAQLKDGTVVAIKVQHPTVKGHAFVDMATMEFLVRVVAWMFPEFQLLWLAEETKKNLPLELDFVNEAKNCERVGKMCSRFKWLKVPGIFWDLTTERVLTMDFCEGKQVNDKHYIEKENISVDQVCKHLGELYSEMIFVHGYIHCDPHPGNVLVKKKPDGETEIVLLDHGLYQTLSDSFRVNYCKLWDSLIKADMEGIKKYAQRMNAGKLYPLFACMLTARSWNSVEQGIDKTEFTQNEDQEIRSNAASYLPEISEILNSVPRQMLLIFKTNDLLRGIESTLDTRPDAKSFITMSKACVRSVYRYRRSKCDGWVCRWKMTLFEHWDLFQITVYEYFLWFQNLSVVQFVIPPKTMVKVALKDMLKEKKDELKEKYQNKKDELKKTYQEKKDEIKDKTEEIIDKIEDKTEEWIDKTEEIIDDIKEEWKDKTEELRDKTEELKSHYKTRKKSS